MASKAPASYQRPSSAPEVKEGMAPYEKISYSRHSRIAAQPALLRTVFSFTQGGTVATWNLRQSQGKPC